MLKIKHRNTMNHCLFKAKDTKGAVGNTVDYSSLTWNPLFVEALQKKPYTEYLLDILLSGSMEERASVVAEYGKEVRKIEQRISEFTASHPAGRHERSRSLSAGAER